MKRIIISFFLSLAILLNVTPASFAASGDIVQFRIPHVADAKGFASSRTSIVEVYFTPLKWVKKVNYVLTYSANGIPQGVAGSFDPNGKMTVKREFFLGTCSGNVCTKNKNVSKIKITTTFEYIDGFVKTRQSNLPLL